MNKQDITRSLDKLAPNDTQKEIMLEAIMSAESDKKTKKKPLRLVAAFSVIIIVVLAAVVIPSISAGLQVHSDTEQDHINSTPALTPAPDEFIMDGKKYTIYEYESLPYSKDVLENQVGEELFTITSDATDTLIGCNVYEYIPADGASITVVVYRDDNYELFAFSGFESLSDPDKNYDADMIEYLEVYGALSADDIQKVNVLFSDSSTDVIEDRQIIEYAYNVLVTLKDSSNKYFQLLEEYIPQNENNTDNYASGDESGMSTGSSGGTTALENTVIFTAILNNGLEMEFHYYPKINFLSRYEIPNDIVDTLSDYYKK